MLIRPRPEVTVRPEIRAHRPPDEFINILMKSEHEFRQYIRSIESEPTFTKLMNEGYIRRVNFKGRIPAHVYLDFRDREFMEFIQKYDITSRPDWESDFFDRSAIRNAKVLAMKYKVPRGELIRALEYCRYMKLSWKEGDKLIPDNSYGSDRPYELLDDKPPIAIEYSLVRLAKLLEHHTISKEQFVDKFLSGKYEAFEIARELDIGAPVVDEILDLLDSVQMLSMSQVNVSGSYGGSHEKDIYPSAQVKTLDDPPRAEISVSSEEIYSWRYRIEEPLEGISKEEESLINKLKMINQRRSLVFRTIMFIFRFQYPFFVSYDPLYLKPLSQAQVAKELGEHEATISRILREKYLETPIGLLPLKFFCQSKKDVIQRLLQVREQKEISLGMRNKPFSDAEIAEILDKEYGVKVSRRTVTYYRNLIESSPKFYVRKRLMRAVG